ncbi:hypothetical protein RJ641_026255 [Dillenia turbinata]|uniref:Uncharacterized protein n=1 Tax=Dillenia turbinata TaxID=194707 RepID=A0AAN8ZSE4_9MAGN
MKWTMARSNVIRQGVGKGYTKINLLTTKDVVITIALLCAMFASRSSAFQHISANIKRKKDIEVSVATGMGVGWSPMDYMSARKKHFAKEVITGFDETDLLRSWVRMAKNRASSKEHDSPTHFFVEEVITGFDETDLRSWVGMAKNRASSKEHDSPTHFFVEEVITGFNETDLLRSWVRAQATRSPQEWNTRLENMCCRIWNLARQKKLLKIESAQRIAKRRFERERGPREATADISEDLSEGEKGDLVSDISAHGAARLPSIHSVDAMETWIYRQKGKKLYIVLIRQELHFCAVLLKVLHKDELKCNLRHCYITLHGLIRGENMQHGRDSDTGAQVTFIC